MIVRRTVPPAYDKGVTYARATVLSDLCGMIADNPDRRG